MPVFRVLPRWRALAVLVVAVLMLHALVLALLPMGVGSGWQGDARRSVQVRQLSLPAPSAPVPVPEAAAPPVVLAPAAPPKVPPAAPPKVPPAAPDLPSPAATPSPAPAPAAEAALPAASAVAEAASAAAPAASEAEPAAVVALAAAEPAAVATAAPAAAVPGGAPPPPVYATRLPPPAVLRYDLRRGALGGSGEIRWQPGAGGRYEIALEGSAFGLTVLHQTSSGGVDGAGLAPERFLDQRRGGRSNAANFQRAAGKITYSGPQAEFPLLPGSQDRVSWVVQLSAIVAADPARFGGGAPVSMFVTGARGDADVWTFEPEGRDAVDVPAGVVRDALKLRRLPRRAYDTLVEVWLDPARAWLPVRMRWTVSQTDETTEFRLTDAEMR